MGLNINNNGDILSEQYLSLNSDLATIFTFKHWVKNNLEIYKDKEGSDKTIKVPYEDLLIYLEFLEEKIISNNVNGDINRSLWVKRIGKLIVKTKKIIRLNKDD